MPLTFICCVSLINYKSLSGTVTSSMEIDVSSPVVSDPSSTGKTIKHDHEADRWQRLSTAQLQRVCLISQISAAEAQERAAVAQERAAIAQERSAIAQKRAAVAQERAALTKRFCYRTKTAQLCRKKQKLICS